MDVPPPPSGGLCADVEDRRETFVQVKRRAWVLMLVYHLNQWCLLYVGKDRGRPALEAFRDLASRKPATRAPVVVVPPVMSDVHLTMCTRWSG